MTANGALESPVRPASATAKKLEEDAVAVRVAVHIRPLVENELNKGCQEILDITNSPAQVSIGQHTFTYDNVYGSGGGDDSANLYPDCVQPLVDGLFKGYNATVFAYGQTGSGKTYTMGSAWSHTLEVQGVIPSVMDELFTRIDAAIDTDITVKVSFVEIHKEEVRDLLWANSAVPRPVVTIRELPSGVSLAGASERLVHSREDMSSVLMHGTYMRSVASTDMNSRSSRSHAIFTITLEQRRRQLVRPASAPPAVHYTPGGTAITRSDSSESDTASEEEDEDEEAETGDEYLIAKMHLVDLAGSERAKRTGAQGARLKEAININKGLLALAKVITALVENQSHIPYRDSKLTRLLQDSLGGNSRTVMIACVSPADINREESLNTLRYADRARRIKNKPIVNRDPVAAQLAALRQQIAGLRAENAVFKQALGGDASAAAMFAAAGTTAQGCASEALQEAYDDLAIRCNALEVDNAKQKMELSDTHDEIKLLRTGLLTAETQRDQALLRLEDLHKSLTAVQNDDVKAAIQKDTVAAAGMGAGQPGQTDQSSPSTTAAKPFSPRAGVDGDAASPAAASAGELGIVASLRARVSELETGLRQARSLQRMTSSVLMRGMGGSVPGGIPARNCGTGSVMRSSRVARSSNNFGTHSLAAAGMLAITADDLEEACSPMTPARQTLDDEADEPLIEAEPDAILLAHSAAHQLAHDAMNHKLDVLNRQMEAKQKRLLALQSAADMQGAKSKYMQELQKERDTLAKEKTALLQKLQAVEAAGAEERKRLEQQYRDKLTSVERRLKDLADREKAAKRSAAQLNRVSAVCQQLQADIGRMKAARAAVQRRMEAKEKEFREWRLMREREVLQLRRNAQRQNAALQQQQAIHVKQQAVLKRKTEEAEAARRKLRDLLELHARTRKEKCKGGPGAGIDEKGTQAVDLELQPNASAPLLRTEKARRTWVEQELELCSTSWQYQKVLDGELAQRAEATRKMREVQKQLMLLGGLVPPSPVVTATAAAAAASRGTGAAAAAAKAALPREEVLQQEANNLQAEIHKHSKNIKELQEQWERARADEQSRGAGAANVKRWTGIRNIVEARELLRTLFMSACSQRAQVYEGQMEFAKLQESADILAIKLDMALQQADEAKRKALQASATAAAVITTPAHHLALAAAANEDDSYASGGAGQQQGQPQGVESSTPLAHQDYLQGRRLQAQLSASRQSSSEGVADLFGQLSTTAVSTPRASSYADDVRDDVDIEADDLLHSMGLPPIQELPSPAREFVDSTADSCRRNLSISKAKYGGYSAASGGNNTYKALLRCKLGGNSAAAGVVITDSSNQGGQVSATGTSTARGTEALGKLPQSSGDDRAASSNVRGTAAVSGLSRRASGGSSAGGLGTSAQALAAKLSALEVDWKGYKQNAAAAAAGNNRRSFSGGQRRGRASSSSVPGSPGAYAAVGSMGGFGLSSSNPGSAAGAAKQQQPCVAVSKLAARQRRGRASLSACSSPVGYEITGTSFWPHQPQGGEDTARQQSTPAAADGVDEVAKSLNFFGVDSPAEEAGQRQQDKQHPERLGQRSSMAKPVGTSSRYSRSKGAAAGAAACSGRWQQHSPAATSEDISSEDAVDSDEDSGDDEDSDPSYDPALHATPVAPRGGGRRAARNSQQIGRQSRLSAGSVEAGDASVSARTSGRWGGQLSANRASCSNSQAAAVAAAATPAGAGLLSANGTRSLAAQVSFNHEKRRGWERPVLDDINIRRGSQGLAAVDKLTIQLLKDALTGHEVDGKPWTAGAKTKDNLIADYRRMLNLNELLDEEMDINRITGAATWSMPSSPTSGDMVEVSRAKAAAAATTQAAAELADSSSSSNDGGRDEAADASTSGSSGSGIHRSCSVETLGAGAARRVRSACAQFEAMSTAASFPPLPNHRYASGITTEGMSSRNLLISSPLRVLNTDHQPIGTSRVQAELPPAAGVEANYLEPRQQHQRQLSQPVVDVGGLLAAGGGAERVLRETPPGVLQQGAQRGTAQRSSSQKLRLSIPSCRVDGPFSARLPVSSSGGGSGGEPRQNQQPLPERASSLRQSQPYWR